MAGRPRGGARHGENKAIRAAEEKRKGGRPNGVASRPPAEVLQGKVEKLLKQLRKGRDLIRAARYARLKLSDVTAMLESNEEFSHAVDKAVDDFEQKHLTHIENAAPDDWRASSWILERRFRHWAAPETQAKSSQANVTADELRKAIFDGLEKLGEQHKGMTREEFAEKHPPK